MPFQGVKDEARIVVRSNWARRWNRNSFDGRGFPDFVEDLVCVVRALAVDGGVEQAVQTERVSLATAGARRSDGDRIHVHLQPPLRMEISGGSSGY